jgi:hypothetical protein
VNSWTDQLIRICLTNFFFLLGISASHATTPLLPVCSWPIESSGHGVLNVATQDTNTTYWFMPLDTAKWRAMIVQGQYPQARLFNFTTYSETGLLIDTIVDANIAP